MPLSLGKVPERKALKHHRVWTARGRHEVERVGGPCGVACRAPFLANAHFSAEGQALPLALHPAAMVAPLRPALPAPPAVSEGIASAKCNGIELGPFRVSRIQKIHAELISPLLSVSPPLPQPNSCRVLRSVLFYPLFLGGGGMITRSFFCNILKTHTLK